MALDAFVRNKSPRRAIGPPRRLAGDDALSVRRRSVFGSSFCTSAVMSASTASGSLARAPVTMRVEVVLDHVGDLQAVVAGEGVPFGQQRELARPRCSCSGS